MRAWLLISALCAGCTIRNEAEQPSSPPTVTRDPSYESAVAGADTSNANRYSRQMLGMHPQDRRVVFGKLVQSAGEACDMADEAVFRGSAGPIDLWRASCPGGSRWSIAVYADSSTKVLSCKIAAQIGVGCDEALTKARKSPS